MIMAFFKSGSGCSSLYKLCCDGNLRKLREFVDQLDENALEEGLTQKKGGFGYTPLHEAAAKGNYEVLDYLLGRTTNSKLVNYRSNNGGYTLLHVAASAGHGACVRTLLQHSADISIVDDYGHTPKQTAELSLKGNIVRLIRSEEVIKDVENGGENLSALLRSNIETLEPHCLERALFAATHNDDHHSIGKLVIKGAKNISECLNLAQRDLKSHAYAMLLLIKAASTGEVTLVQELFGYAKPDSDEMDRAFYDAQKAAQSGRISTVVPIEIAQRHCNTQVREELLLKTDVNQEEGYVYWHGLRLLKLDINWLMRISWVKNLRLARNGFKFLPEDIGIYLRQVVKISLNFNELSMIPDCLLQLPNLEELNLAHNKLTHIPDIKEWSSCLTILDLSHNQLSSMPTNITAPVISSLNLSFNNFQTVPLSICSFVTLHSLDLGDNPDIITLPTQMGRLANLSCLHLNNLKYLKDLPRNILKDPRDCISYLNSKLQSVKAFYRMKISVIGNADRGKTTLIKKLGGNECGDVCTQGVEISEWYYKPRLGKKPFQFTIWDFNGEERYSVINQCFLSQHSLFLLLFNLKDGDDGVLELKSWLDNLALRVSKSYVIIIGTHLDEIPDGKREEIDSLLLQVGNLSRNYSKLQIVEVMPVGLKNKVENIGILKEAIYSHASSYKTQAGVHIMGQNIPASYHALDKQMWDMLKEVKQGLREPIMHAEEFNAMVRKMGLEDIQNKEELKTVTLFLAHHSSLIHCDDCGHNLHEIYFIDPQWLCEMMVKVIDVTERNLSVKKGILHSNAVLTLFKNNKFIWKYIEQFIAFLVHFEIALPLNNKLILIPSMLPRNRPVLPKMDIPVYTRYFLFNSQDGPPLGFWSRLLSMIMYSIPQISLVLDTVTDSSMDKEKEDSSPSLPEINELMKPNTSERDSFLLPNFPSSLETKLSYDVKDVQIDYWCRGVYYCDTEVMFRIESLAESKIARVHTDERKEGILIVTSHDDQGKRILGKLVNLVTSLVQYWYPDLANQYCLEQRVACFECIKLKYPIPFDFRVEDCLSEILNHKTAINCGYYQDDPAVNHTVFLTDIVPDLLLQDIDPNILLDSNEVDCQNDDASLLGNGYYAKVYKGVCRDRSVAIKKYAHNKKAFSSFSHEVKILQELHHPCLVQLVGMYMQPTIASVLEEAPLNTLEISIIKNKIPIHRLTVFRIAAEVAAALHYMHSKGIVYHNLHIGNVLVWTLDPASLCHCKLAGFHTSTHRFPMGVRGVVGANGFIAPEALHTGIRSVHDHRVDIFSFGMFLYELIARKSPYEKVIHRDNVLAEVGERPTLQYADIATTGYHSLTMLMKNCWKENPNYRPTTDEIIKTVSLASTQSIMHIFPAKSKLSLRKAVALTPTDFNKAGVTNKKYNELWVCCDGVDGIELNMFVSHTMFKSNKTFIRDRQVLCMTLCNDHIWMATRAGIECSNIEIFSIATRELVHSIKMKNDFVSSMISFNSRVFVGTVEGYCCIFSNDIQENALFRHKYLSKHAIDGIAYVNKLVWVSYNRYIDILNPDSLDIEGSVSRYENQTDFIGQLSVSPSDEAIIWSAHLGGTFLTAWNTVSQTHIFDVDTGKLLQEVAKPSATGKDLVITAMVPTLDTVWVGMSSGHIMVFHQDELLTWYHPYNECVRFLTAIPTSGPCELEKCMVVSGGKDFTPPVNGMDYDKMDDVGHPSDIAGVLIVWEAFEAKTLRQITHIEENAPDFLDSYDSILQLICRGEFKDGTCISENKKIV